MRRSSTAAKLVHWVVVRTDEPGQVVDVVEAKSEHEAIMRAWDRRTGYLPIGALRAATMSDLELSRARSQATEYQKRPAACPMCGGAQAPRLAAPNDTAAAAGT